MPINHDRRIYVTFKNAAEVAAIKNQADKEGKSASRYVIDRLELLNYLERDPIGSAIIETIKEPAR